MQPGWNGDKYGNAHAEPIGKIWLYGFYAAFPFSAIALGWMALRRRELRTLLFGKRTRSGGSTGIADNGWNLYLLLWTAMPLCFFTTAGNIIWTYALTSLPAFACLAMELQRQQRPASVWPAHGFLLACCIIPITGIVVSTLYLTGSTHVKTSQRELVQTWQALPKDADSKLVYFNQRYPSALFYSQGKVTSTRKNSALRTLLGNTTTDFIVIKNRDLIALSPDVRQHFRTLQSFPDTLLMQEIITTVP